MSAEMLEAYIRQIIESHRTPDGELGLNYLRDATRPFPATSTAQWASWPSYCAVAVRRRIRHEWDEHSGSRRTSRGFRVFPLAVLAFTLLSTSAAAQTVGEGVRRAEWSFMATTFATARQPEGWEVCLSPYLWASGVEGEVQILALRERTASLCPLLRDAKKGTYTAPEEDNV